MSAIEAITVPKWGLTMTEGTLIEWLVSEGSTIAVGDAVADMETSKIVNIVESNVEGTLRRIVAQPGDTLEIGALLAVVADLSVADGDIDEYIASFVIEGVASTDVMGGDDAQKSTPTPATSSAAQQAEPSAAEAPVVKNEALEQLGQGEDDSEVHASRYARQLARQYSVNLNNVTGTGRNGRVSKVDVAAAITAAGGQLQAPAVAKPDLGAARSTADDSGIKATSVARRLAKALGINLHDCRASGDRGRVCKADVEAADALLNGTPATPAAVATGSLPQEVATPEFEESPMTGMRKTIATRLQESKQQAPHFRQVVDCQIDPLLALRKQINDAHPGVKVSVNDFLIKASAMALAKSPDVNVQFDGETVKRFKHADISVAVALENGLITPIVKRADTLSLTEISNEMRALATKAKAGQLKPEEFVGGTFTVSNLGMFGIKQFDAIINPPQAGILAVGSGEKRVVADGNEMRVATIVTLSASFDHRVVDGAVGAAFMSELKRFVENPALMLA